MEFLLGNPFTTPVGQCIEKATDGSLQNEDWTLNMEICDIINETEEGPKDAIRAIKKRLNGNRNFREVMLALIVLETCVKNCGHRFHVFVATRDFIDGILVKIISPKINPPTIVQDKVLALIQASSLEYSYSKVLVFYRKTLSAAKKHARVICQCCVFCLQAWADAFRSSPDLTGVVQIYEELKRKGVEFPMADLDALSPIHTPQRGVPEIDPASHKYKASPQPKPASQPPQTSAASVLPAQTPLPNMAGPITPNPEQIARLRSELDIVRGNCKVMSEMLTEMVPGQEDASDLELLQELNRTCRAMQQRIVELISRVSNEEVTEELLHVNDDLNNIFLRYERYERYRLGWNAQKNGVLNEASVEDNLIDLGPGSPAVVTPRTSAAATPTPPSSLTTAAAATAPSLSTQLAGLNLDSESVSGTLSELSAHNPRDDFDMFAQTRSSSLADQRKNMKYEDPQALGGLASALDVRQQNTAGLSVKGDNAELEPIDSWLITQGMKGDEAEEGVTSEEFDKFLEERAKVVDAALPSPPRGEPSAPASAPSSSRKKAERTEDNLFAL
ncbi:hypothetical protein QTP70_024050 [Hemibagrus guttatus]|uniref:TOM1-like protein 2 n=1 Tax=Hemibagrus guttatus TaxID=175788 RepID=A0AAE0QEW6_9TELE|nr:hypothetical protein QTP70_024050 [Hemibagrus guttatus]KAK3552789.1 hypothetical protein QTP86_022595 [Hemibagrus guttatus]